MGAYLAVMGVLGIERDLEGLGAAAFAGAGATAVAEDPPQQLPAGDPVPASRPASQAVPSGDDSPNSGPVSGAAAADRATDIDTRVALPIGAAATQGPFDWLDAPAQDLRELVRSTAPERNRTVVARGDTGGLRDLFDDPGAEVSG
jgi:hypothetical protein